MELVNGNKKESIYQSINQERLLCQPEVAHGLDWGVEAPSHLRF